MPQPPRRAAKKKDDDAAKPKPSRSRGRATPPPADPPPPDADGKKPPRERSAEENARQPRATGLPADVKGRLKKAYEAQADDAEAQGRPHRALALNSLARSFVLDGPAVGHAVASAQAHATLDLADEVRRLTLTLTRDRDVDDLGVV